MSSFVVSPTTRANQLHVKIGSANAPCIPTSSRYPPYAVVAALSGVCSSSAADTPNSAQKARCVPISRSTFVIVCVADSMAGKESDFAASRLGVSQSRNETE
jgi:hypothetical protein